MLTGDAFTEMGTSEDFPVIDFVKITTVAAYMRFAIRFYDFTGLGANFAATIGITGVGRN